MAKQWDMEGVLFKTDRRRNGREDPLLQGSCTIPGGRYWIAAWPARNRRECPPAPRRSDGDDVPF
jgi:hypothetical protein